VTAAAQQYCTPLHKDYLTAQLAAEAAVAAAAATAATGAHGSPSTLTVYEVTMERERNCTHRTALGPALTRWVRACGIKPPSQRACHHPAAALRQPAVTA
jgi:hypothetical protein